MECSAAIHGRRSIRQYTPEGVEPEFIEGLLRAAMAAPSAGNQQSWRFVVVTQRAQLDRLAQATPYSSPLARAPLGIVVCGDTVDERHPGYWVQDCSAATQNLLLMAHSLGLGAVWIGVHPIQERVDNVREICSIPQRVTPLGMIAIGHPAEEKPPVDRFDAAFVHSEVWAE